MSATSDKKPQSYTDYEKPSRHQQWQERSERPIAAKHMNKEEIEEFRRNLVASYKCKDEDITYDFQKIFDEKDDDRDDCLWLKYKMKCIYAGKPTIREVFNIKLPIPEQMKRMAEILKKQQAERASKKASLAKPAQNVQTEQTVQPIIEEPADNLQNTQNQENIPEVDARPKLRKPTRIIRKPTH
ncbi:Hypothetical protein PACV_405 [Pacmanvirus A23]|uniref:Hypothetical protein n=1 Tax=Pacmanvirus A23 TaxID=1932881 RepID=UPI000A0953BD|nr:Hypothetical protein B9W72_gp401 [Pacmanvirus A23]SIP86118.1 Hypothetical protein PACV_405 [Pacmanvirus A23]